jgi:hypothetical protein
MVLGEGMIKSRKQVFCKDKNMSQLLTTIPAHFDGKQVQFDVEVELGRIRAF